MGGGLINSFAISLPATFIPLLVAAFAAYAFTFMVFPGRDFLFLAIVSLLVVPNYVAFVPMLQIYAKLDMNGTFPAVWLAHVGFGMSLAIYILRNYMATLPQDDHRVGQGRRCQPLPDLLAAGAADVRAGVGGVRHLPVPVGLERPAGRPDVHRTRRERAGHPEAQCQLKGQFGQGANLTTAGAFVTMLVPWRCSCSCSGSSSVA